MRLLIVLAILLSVVGCAKKGKSNANFKLVLAGLSAADVESYAQGGMMIWGKNAAGDKSFADNVDTVSGEFSIEVDNTSDWSFVAIMWDGGDDYDPATPVATPYPFYGVPRCASATASSSDLQSGDVSLSMSLSNTNCNDAATFGYIVEEATPVIYRFASVATISCRQNALASVSDFGYLCESAETGLASSVNTSLALVTDGVPRYNQEMKECYSFYDPPGVSSRANIPTNVAIFPRVYRQYVGNQFCDDLDTRGYHVTVVNSAAGAEYKSYQDDSADPFALRTYLAVPEAGLCSGNRTSTFYATGSADSFWVGICTPEQWNYIANNSATYYMRNLILLNDLNFFGNFNPAVDAGPSPLSFTPFGGTDLSLPPNPFQALFEGNFKKVIGTEFEYSSSGPGNDLGFFRRIGGSGIVRNFKMVFPMLEMSDERVDQIGVGAIAGYNEGTIQAVKVVEGEVEGFADVGGLVGVNVGSISASSFSGRVSGLKTLGGIAGRNAGGTLLQVAASEAYITSDRVGVCSNSMYQNSADCIGATETWYESTDLGGVFGVIDACSAPGDFNEVAARSIISGGTKLGGFAGRVADSVTGCDLVDVLVRPVLTATEPMGDVGGIFGYVGNSVTATVDRLVMPEVYLQGANAYLDIGNAPTPQTYITYPSSNSKIYDANTQYVFNTTDSGTKPTIATAAQRYQLATYSGAAYDISAVTQDQKWFLPAAGFSAPRLSFEGPDECDGKYGTNIVAGNGSATSPYLICNASQLKNFNSVGAVTGHYKLMKNIDLAHEEAFQAGLSVSDFQGQLNGNFKWVTGFKLGGGGQPTNKNGLFRAIEPGASVKNLNLVADIDYFNVSGGAVLTGTLAGINHGSITGVNVFGKFKFIDDSETLTGSVGGLVGTNQGVISGSRTHMDMEIGVNGVGGIAGRNTGGIVYSESYARMKLVRNSLNNIGGVVGLINTPMSVQYFDPITNSNKTIAGTIDNIRNSASISTNDGMGNYTGGHTNVGGIVGSMQEGTIKNVDNRAFIDLKALVYENVWTPSVGPLSCGASDYKYSRSNGAGSQHLTTWVVDDIALCINGVVKKLPCAPEGMPPGAENSGTSAFVPLCNFGTIAGKTTYATAVIENNMSQASVNFNVGVGVDENRILAHTSVGKWIGSLGSGTFVNNGLINMPRFRSFNQSERTLNPTTLTSSNMNLQWGVSNYHEVFPLTPADGSGTAVSLYTTPPAGIIFNDDYLWAYGQGPYVMNSISGSSITASAPPLPGLPYQNDLFYYSAATEISSLSFLMDSDYGFDVSLESEDLNTSWFVSDDETSYWNNYSAYEDIIYNGHNIGVYLNAIQ